MDQLWAPWRMGYIGSEPEPGCLFCNTAKEVDRDEANYVLFRAEHAFVMLNLYPYNSGHAMVVPYVHTGNISLLPAEVAAGLFSTAQLTVRAFEHALKPHGFNLGMNQGSVAGAGIADHVHLHVVPRWDGDTNFMPVLANTKVMPELLSATANKLRPAFVRGDARE